MSHPEFFAPDIKNHHSSIINHQSCFLLMIDDQMTALQHNFIWYV